MIEIVLPWPPSVNHYWRHDNGITHVSAQGKKYRLAVVAIIREMRLKPIIGAISVKRILYCPDKRRRDEDNITKALYDAVSAAGLWQDDSFICSGSVEKRLSADRVGRVVLQIEKLTKDVLLSKSGAWLKG